MNADTACWPRINTDAHGSVRAPFKVPLARPRGVVNAVGTDPCASVLIRGRIMPLPYLRLVAACPERSEGFICGSSLACRRLELEQQLLGLVEVGRGLQRLEHG